MAASRPEIPQLGRTRHIKRKAATKVPGERRSRGLQLTPKNLLRRRDRGAGIARALALMFDTLSTINMIPRKSSISRSTMNSSLAILRFDSLGGHTGTLWICGIRPGDWGLGRLKANSATSSAGVPLSA